jgi:hypothetical protein
MEFRNKSKGGFTDELIFSSRIPASLLDMGSEESDEGSEEE